MEPEHDPSADPTGDAMQSSDFAGRRAARVIVQRSDDGGRILIHPNRSLTRAGLLVATAACLSALMPATLLCLLLGAWPLLPFLGLEVAVAVGAFGWLTRHRLDHEEIRLDAEQVAHRRIDGRITETETFPRYWVRLVIQPGDGARRPPRLWLRSHGRRVELGRAGSAPTRALLAHTLTRDFGIAEIRERC
jgi:uncharacterized membrane protein